MNKKRETESLKLTNGRKKWRQRKRKWINRPKREEGEKRGGEVREGRGGAGTGRW